MRCVNCQSPVNQGAIVCPYCHFNPYLMAIGPYDGAGAPLIPGISTSSGGDGGGSLGFFGSLKRLFCGGSGSTVIETFEQNGVVYKKLRCNNCGYDINYRPSSDKNCGRCKNKL